MSLWISLRGAWVGFFCSKLISGVGFDVLVFLSSRGLILSFPFDRRHVSWRFDEDNGVYPTRSSSSSSVVGVGVIIGLPIGVLSIGGFFACGVAFFFGSVCLSIRHVGVALR